MREGACGERAGCGEATVRDMAADSEQEARLAGVVSVQIEKTDY